MNYWMRRLRVALPWLVIAALSAALVMLALLPAAWITPQFSKQTRGHVNLVDPAGSLWHGSATLMLAAGSDMSAATLLPGRIEWTTSFWPLFTGRVRMTMRHSEAMPDPVTVDATLRTATVTPGAMTVPASLLGGLGAPFNTLDLQGKVQLSWSDWRSFNREAFGQLTVTLNDVSSRISLRQAARLVSRAVPGAGRVVHARSDDHEGAADAERQRHGVGGVDFVPRRGQRRARGAGKSRGLVESVGKADRAGFGGADLRALKQRRLPG